MRLICFVAVFVVSAFASTQDWTSRGKIDSRTTEIPRRENGQVVGTEFVHYEYKVSTSLVPTDDKYPLTYTWHRNQCRGGKHDDHGKCTDTSCDDKAMHTTRGEIQGNAWPLTTEMRKMEKDSARMAKGLGMAGGPANWSSASSSYISQMIAECNAKVVPFESAPHDTPCTHRYREFGQKLTQIKVRGEFWKVGVFRSRGVDTPINQMVGSHEGTVAELWYPESEPLQVKDGVLCKCKPRPAPDKPTYVDPGPSGGEIPSVTGPGGCEYEDKDDKPVCPYEDQVAFDCTGIDLSQLLLEIENKCSEELQVTIPSGCEFVPENDGTQIMTCTEGLKVGLPPKSTVYAWIGAEPRASLFDKLIPPSVEARIKVACTQIQKSMPTSKSKFKMRPTEDPRLKTVLEQPSGSSFFANTVTQGRLWIYKDGSTREQINKVLIPGMTEGMYLNALYGLDRAGIDLSSGKYRKCLDPKLLNGATASKETTVWFYRLLEQMDPKSTEKLRKQSLDEAKRVLGGVPEKIDVRHVAHMAYAMGDSQDKETRLAALSILELNVPAEMRTEFIVEGGIDVLRSAMTFGEDADALRAVQIAKAYPGPETKELLSAMADWGRESIRAAAAEAIKG